MRNGPNDGNSNRRYYHDRVQDCHCENAAEHEAFVQGLDQEAKDYIWVIHFFLMICFVSSVTTVYLVADPNDELSEYFVNIMDPILAPLGYNVSSAAAMFPFKRTYTQDAIIFCILLYFGIVWFVYG